MSCCRASPAPARRSRRRSGVRRVRHAPHRLQQPARDPVRHTGRQQHCRAADHPGRAQLRVVEMLLRARAHRFDRGQRQPAHGQAVHDDGPLDRRLDRAGITGHPLAVLVEQREAPRRAGQVGRSMLDRRHLRLRHQRPQQPAPQLRLLAQEVPTAAVLPITSGDAGARKFQPVDRLLVEVADEVPVQVDVREHAHRQRDRHGGAEDGDEQPGGEGERKLHPGERGGEWTRAGRMMTGAACGGQAVWAEPARRTRSSRCLHIRGPASAAMPKILTPCARAAGPRASMPRPAALSLLVAFAAVLAAVLAAGCGEKKTAAAAPAPPEVGVVIVATQDAPLALELPGRLSASQVAEIRPQVSGIVQKRLFEEGTTVRAGQALYQLDAASYEAERARAAADLQKAEAQVAVARTRAERDAELLKADALSRQSADDSASALRQAQADVAVARAALDAARVQLDRTRTRADLRPHRSFHRHRRRLGHRQPDAGADHGAAARSDACGHRPEQRRDPAAAPPARGRGPERPGQPPDPRRARGRHRVRPSRHLAGQRRDRRPRHRRGDAA
ncbi:efflux RND transporter periplasmic adaptor subunit, partial [Mitsuaria sp. TWR114]